MFYFEIKLFESFNQVTADFCCSLHSVQGGTKIVDYPLIFACSGHFACLTCLTDNLADNQLCEDRNARVSIIASYEPITLEGLLIIRIREPKIPPEVVGSLVSKDRAIELAYIAMESDGLLSECYQAF